MGFGAFYLGSDFLIHQGDNRSETVQLIYETFDMPFYFCAGMYALASLREWVHRRYEIPGMNALVWMVAIVWIVVLLYLNLGFESWL